MNKTITLDKEYELNFTAKSVKDLEEVSGKTLGQIFEIATSAFNSIQDKKDKKDMDVVDAMLKSPLLDATFIGQLIWAGISGKLSLDEVYEKIPLNKLMNLGVDAFTAFVESILPEEGEPPETTNDTSKEVPASV